MRDIAGTASYALKRYLLLCAIGFVLTSFIQNFTRKTVAVSLKDDAGVNRVLEILRNTVSATTEEQARITEIPAPPFHETARAAYMKKLLMAAGLRVETDAIGNVIGEFPKMLKSKPRCVYFQMYSPSITRYLLKAC